MFNQIMTLFSYNDKEPWYSKPLFALQSKLRKLKKACSFGLFQSIQMCIFRSKCKSWHQLSSSTMTSNKIFILYTPYVIGKHKHIHISPCLLTNSSTKYALQFCSVKYITPYSFTCLVQKYYLYPTDKENTRY
jgi:hypothetical protein